MYDTSDLKKGLKVEIDGEPYVVTDAQFVKPGKGNAFTRCKLKSLISGLVLDRTWRSGEKIDRCSLEERPMEYLYKDDDGFHFMNTSSYEQLALSNDQVGESGQWLTENTEVDMLFHNGKPISISMPNFVELEIVETEPGVKGDTKSSTMKPATLSTGAVAQVPLFVNQNEWIKIDTRTGSYVERVKK